MIVTGLPPKYAVDYGVLSDIMILPKPWWKTISDGCESFDTLFRRSLVEI